jgi:hypothetical protein
MITGAQHPLDARNTPANGENDEGKGSGSWVMDHGSRDMVQGSRIKDQEPRVITQGSSDKTQAVRIPPSFLRELGEKEAYTGKGKEKRARYQLARAIAGLQERLGRKLSFEEMRITSNGWHEKGKGIRTSHERHLAALIREVATVKKPKGGNGDFQRTKKTVADLPIDKLPLIPAFPHASEDWRRAAALHRELARRANGGDYALSRRETASALEWDEDEAAGINYTLTTLGVIEQVENGAPGKRKGVAARWRYLLPDDDNEDEESVF